MRWSPAAPRRPLRCSRWAASPRRARCRPVTTIPPRRAVPGTGTATQENGEAAARCMENALRNARLNREDIDYINAHGTSTPLGDLAETIAVKRCFGDHARKIAVSSTKSMIGHLLGAAGGVEAIFSVLAIRDQVAPPTANLFNQDPACDLDYVPNAARRMPLRTALSNSFGFGGTNGTLIFKRV